MSEKDEILRHLKNGAEIYLWYVSAQPSHAQLVFEDSGVPIPLHLFYAMRESGLLKMKRGFTPTDAQAMAYSDIGGRCYWRIVPPPPGYGYALYGAR